MRMQRGNPGRRDFLSAARFLRSGYPGMEILGDGGGECSLTVEIISGRAGTSLSSIFTARPEARTRMRDFFSSHIRNPNTRRAYREAVRQFSGFCAEHGIVDLAQVEPVHVAAFVEAQLKLHSRPTAKKRRAARPRRFACR